MAGVVIRGGADQVEAAVISAVLERISAEEAESKRAKTAPADPGLPAWVRALSPERPGMPRERVFPV